MPDGASSASFYGPHLGAVGRASLSDSRPRNPLPCPMPEVVVLVLTLGLSLRLQRILEHGARGHTWTFLRRRIGVARRCELMWACAGPCLWSPWRQSPRPHDAGCRSCEERSKPVRPPASSSQLVLTLLRLFCWRLNFSTRLLIPTEKARRISSEFMLNS